MSTQEETKPFVIEQRDQIEIYAGQKGHVVLKQTSYMGEDEAMILIHPDDVEQLISHVKNATIDAKEIRESLGKS